MVQYIPLTTHFDQLSGSSQWVISAATLGDDPFLIEGDSYLPIELTVIFVIVSVSFVFIVTLDLYRE